MSGGWIQVRAILVGLVLVVACAAKDGPDSGAGDDTAPGDTDTDTGVHPDAPVVLSIDYVYCEPPSSTPETYLAKITAEDPQGASDIDRIGGGWALHEGGTELIATRMACAAGACTGSIGTVQGGPACAVEADLTHVFTVTDVEGHVSAPMSVEGTVAP